MCRFLSFALDFSKGTSIKCSDVNSHNKTISYYKLAPNNFREAEWTDETTDSLEIRLCPDENESKREFYKQWILSRFSTRSKLLDYILQNWPSTTLDLSGTSITKLPKNLKINGSLDVSDTCITQLPENLKVSGYLNASNTLITRLPKNLKLSGSLFLQNTPITTLPENLKIKGSLDLQNTPITVLPENLEVDDFIYLSPDKVEELSIPIKLSDKIIWEE